MNPSIIDSLTSKKEVLVIHPYTPSEIQNPTFGGTRLIAEQIAYLRERENDVKVVSLAEIASFTSFLYRIQAKMRKKAITNTGNIKPNKYDRGSEKRRWWLNLVQVLVNEYSSSVDILFRHSVDKLTRSISNGSLVIYHYPYGARFFASCAKRNGLRFTLYQHNIEWKFFEDRLVEGFARKMLLPRAKRIELRAIETADLIALASDKDRLSLESEKDLKKPHMVSWIPICTRTSQTVFAEIPEEIRIKFEGKIVVGFVGTNFEPNIVAVESILTFARSWSGSVVFLIVGSVDKAFKGRKDIPHNVIFTGYVPELDSYLSQCDLFVNPKTTSDTGVEVKMFDYLKFNKPILSTEIGATAFESMSQVKIIPIEKMADSIPQFVGVETLGK